jgi:hypothetical protein
MGRHAIPEKRVPPMPSAPPCSCPTAGRASPLRRMTVSAEAGTAIMASGWRGGGAPAGGRQHAGMPPPHLGAGWPIMGGESEGNSDPLWGDRPLCEDAQACCGDPPVLIGAGDGRSVPEWGGDGRSAACGGDGSQRRAGCPRRAGEPSDPEPSGGASNGPSCGRSVGDASIAKGEPGTCWGRAAGTGAGTWAPRAGTEAAEDVMAPAACCGGGEHGCCDGASAATVSAPPIYAATATC